MRFVRPIFLAALFVAFLLQGCAQKGVQSTTGTNLTSNLEAISKGRARLTCHVECSGSWGAARRKLRSLHDNKLWEDLAVEVSKNGFESDLGYYYLGRAAAGLGNPEAALIYYRLGLTKIHKCDGIINNCDGFTFPKDIQAQIALITQSAQPSRQAQTPPPQARPKQPSANSQPNISTGSGFFVSNNGYLVTNWHVVEDAKAILVITFDQQKKLAKVVGRDTANDLAILQIEGSTKYWLPINENSSAIKRGTEVVAVGFPRVAIQGFEPKVTNGIISSLSGISNDPRMFQISVPIQPGNSGGPLVTMDGAVVGVVSAKLRATDAMQRSSSLPENVNYAVKSNYLIELLNSHSVRAKYDTRKLSKELKMTTLTENVERATALILTSDE